MGIYAFLCWYFHGDIVAHYTDWPIKTIGVDPAGNRFPMPGNLASVYNDIEPLKVLAINEL